MTQGTHAPTTAPPPARVGEPHKGRAHSPDTAAHPSHTGPALDPRGINDERLTASLLDKSTRENFPVATRLLPARIRRDLLALYGYARLVDDLGDEAPGDRARLLDLVDADLSRVYRGEEATLPVVRTLATTIAAHDIPDEPFRRLIAANRQDQEVVRYPTYADLVDYCTLSANPVGRVVLHLFDAVTPARVAWSDQVCTALQIAEHLQDVAEDLRRGRIYLPAEDMERFGCTESDLHLAVAPCRVRRLVRFERRRAAALLEEGATLVGTLPGLARIAVGGYVAGGQATFAAIAAAGDDVLAQTPRPARSRLLREWLRLLGRGGVG